MTRGYDALRDRTPRALRRPAARAVETARGLTGGLRAVPDFIIAGTQRGGTNSLYEYLVSHPLVDRAIPGQEVHFFDLNLDRGMRWYRGHFPLASAARRGDDPRRLTGESSPYYMFHPRAPRRIARALPNVRIIVVLRDPIDRAYSHYHHERSRGAEDLSFEDAIASEEARLAGEEEALETDPRYRSFEHQHHSYVARGMYAPQVRRLYETFGPDRVSVLISEEIFRDPLPVVHDLLAFLGLPARGAGAFEQRNAGRYSEMPRSTRTSLAERFRDSNDDLVRLIGRDLPWD